MRRLTKTQFNWSVLYGSPMDLIWVLRVKIMGNLQPIGLAAPPLTIHFAQGLSYSPGIRHQLWHCSPWSNTTNHAILTACQCSYHPFVIIPQHLIFIFVPLHFLIIPLLFSLAFHTCYRKWHILYILGLYNTYNTVVDAAHSKKVHSISVSPTCCSASSMKLPRESLWTPWGWVCGRLGTQLPATLPGSTKTLPGHADMVFDVEGAPWPPLSIPYHFIAAGALRRWFIGLWWLCAGAPSCILALAVPPGWWGWRCCIGGCWAGAVPMWKTLKDASMSQQHHWRC